MTRPKSQKAKTGFGSVADAEKRAALATGRPGWRAKQLPAIRQTRAFLLRQKGQSDRLLRLILDTNSTAREEQACKHLQQTTIALLPQQLFTSPEPMAHSQALYSGSGRLSLWDIKKADIESIALLFAELHNQPSLGLMRSFPAQEKPNILSVFQRLVEQQRTYLLYREQDGLAQDMLTLALADLGRVVRRFVVAAEHYFTPHPRRVLCHGYPAPTRLLRDRRGYHLYGFEQARVGDAARDLALLSILAGFSEPQEQALLECYLDALSGRDDRLIHRYFAHKVLLMLERPVSRLLGLYHIKYDGAPIFDHAVVVLRQEMELVAQELAQALTLLNDFLGRGRPVAPRDVRSMGRLVTYEEYLLQNKPLMCAIEGPAGSQKTAVSTLLASRIQAVYLHVEGLLKIGLALAEQTRGEPAKPPNLASVIATLRQHQVRLEPLPEAPYYRAVVDDEVFAEGSAPQPDPVDGSDAGVAQLLQDPRQKPLLDYLKEQRGDRTVLQAERLGTLLPKNAHCFRLSALPAAANSKAATNSKAANSTPPDSPHNPGAPLRNALDTADTPLPQVVLHIIQSCLPKPTLQEILVPDFTGRRPIFER